MNHACTRRYTRARVQRTLVSLLIQMERNKIKKYPPLDTLRILGFNETGRQYLKQLQQQEVRVASRFNQIPKPYRVLEYRSAVIYSMFKKDREAFLKREISGPVIL